jgi:hypothetical protein
MGCCGKGRCVVLHPIISSFLFIEFLREMRSRRRRSVGVFAVLLFFFFIFIFLGNGLYSVAAMVYLNGVQSQIGSVGV